MVCRLHLSGVQGPREIQQPTLLQMSMGNGALPISALRAEGFHSALWLKFVIVRKSWIFGSKWALLNISE